MPLVPSQRAAVTALSKVLLKSCREDAKVAHKNDEQSVKVSSHAICRQNIAQNRADVTFLVVLRHGFIMLSPQLGPFRKLVL